MASPLPTSRPNSRISTAATRRTLNRLGRRARQRGATTLKADGQGNNDRSDSERANGGCSRGASDFIEFGGADIYNDQGWDTDLEAEPTDGPTETFDVPTRSVYQEACKSNDVIPVSYFLRHLNDPHLDMSHHGLGAHGMKPLAAALTTSISVLKLNLEDNWLDVDGGRCVCEMLKENCYITQLVLSNNRLSTDFAEHFAEALLHNNTLTHVVLSGNVLTDESASFIAEALSNTNNIKFLDLSCNRLGEVAGVALATGIADNISVRWLDLSWNHIRRKGAVSIAQSLKVNSTIQVLNLSWNGFGVEGAKALGDAIKLNSTLEELDVANNRFTPEAAVLIGKGLSVNESIKVLKIGKNQMQSAGCYAVCAAIIRNPNCAIKQLDFSDILVNADFVDITKRAKEQFPDLQIHHGGDHIPYKPKARTHPIIRMRNYAEKHNVRLVDFFQQYDTDRRMRITREQFIAGVEAVGVKLSEDDIKQLLWELDADSTGEVNYSELLLSNQDYTDKEKKLLQNIMALKDGGDDDKWKK